MKRRILGRGEGRADDNEKTIIKRIDVFEKETRPLAPIFEKQGILVRIVKNLSSPKQKLFLLIVLDAVLRIFNMYSDEYSKYFIKEIFFTCFTTIQFTIIISLLNQIFEKSSESFDADMKIGNQCFLTSLFFVLVFSFKGIFESYKLLSAFNLYVL